VEEGAGHIKERVLEGSNDDPGSVEQATNFSSLGPDRELRSGCYRSWKEQFRHEDPCAESTSSICTHLSLWKQRLFFEADLKIL
jgi:hypothetical protein